jgi:hypothetical protein
MNTPTMRHALVTLTACAALLLAAQAFSGSFSVDT